MSDEINAVLDRIEEAQRPLLGSRPSTPLEFLEAVYCNEGLPISIRMRAVTAQVNGDDFAAALERATKRSAQVIDQPMKAITSGRRL